MELKTDEEFEIVLFYVTLISRGILFLHKNIGTDPKCLNWTHDNYLVYSIIFCEAFTPEIGIVGAVMPERVPVAHPTNSTLKDFTFRQYLLLHRFWDLESIFKRQPYQWHLTSEYKEDPDRYHCFTYSNVMLRSDISKTDMHIHVQYKPLFNAEFQTY